MLQMQKGVRAQLLEKRRAALLKLLNRLRPEITREVVRVQMQLAKAATFEELAETAVAYAKWKLSIDIRRSINENRSEEAERDLNRLYGILIGSRACDRHILDMLETRYQFKRTRGRAKPADPP